MSTRPRRLGLWIPWGVFALLAIGWCVYWAAIAEGARQGLARIVAVQEAAGASVSIGATRTRGFPLQLALDLEDVAYVRPGGLRISTARILAHINPVNPLHVLIDFPSPVDVTQSDAPHRITAAPLQASIRLNARTRALAQAGIAATALRMIDLENGAVDFEIEEFAFNVRPDPRAANEMQGALVASNITLRSEVRGAEALGRGIATLNAALVFDHADALGWRGDPLYAWREAGGGARVEGLLIDWGGVRAEGAGRITLDDARRLEGDLALDVASPAHALRRIASAPARTTPQRVALEALARSFEDDESARLNLRGDDGALAVNGIVLRDLAPLYGAP